MSDDPASIEAWQEEEKGDLVARLRVINHHTKKLAENEGLHYVHREAFTRCEDLTWEAANEIERLRKKLLAEENAYDILRLENERIRAELVTISNKLNLERDEGVVDIERLLKERDEARREVCMAEANHLPTMADPRREAKRRGWDCFKEVTDER